MNFPKIHESEYRFCLIMWEHEPVTAARSLEQIFLITSYVNSHPEVDINIIIPNEENIKKVLNACEKEMGIIPSI